MQKYFLILSLLLGVVFNLYAQEATNVRVQQEGEQIIITYDLDKTAYVYVYVSIGDSEQYTLLKAVTGNVGKGVQPGTNRRITWTPLEECTKFAARDVCFRVESMPDVPLFWVSPTKAVIFAPGNLQYQPSSNTWRFAPHQWEYIGEANKNISKTYNGWIDLFSWGTGDNPIGARNEDEYFIDWGINTIGTHAPNTWRTLAHEEWTYLFMHTRWTMAKVAGILGFILLPDNFVPPKNKTIDILSNGDMLDYAFDFNESDYILNQYTAAEFAQLDAVGCIFLPCAGFFGLDVYRVGSFGRYWSASPRGKYDAGQLGFDSVYAFTNHFENRSYGQSVRLVQELSLEEYTEFVVQNVRFKVAAMPNVTSFRVSPTKAVIFSPGNLQYRASTNTWRFAPHQWEYIGMIGNLFGIQRLSDDWIDLFGWGTGNNPTKSSEDEHDYQRFVDWGINTIGTDKPNTWRTLTQEEWTYLFMHTRWTIAKVDGKLGFILLPDNFIFPQNLAVSILGNGYMSVPSLCFKDPDYILNQYSTTEFTQLETRGCVFLPCAGYRVGLGALDVGSSGHYWSATPCSEYSSKEMGFGLTSAGVYNWVYRFYGLSVRLVRDL